MPTDLASSLKRERALAQASKPEQGASFTDRFCQCIAVRWRRERSRRARQSGHIARWHSRPQPPRHNLLAHFAERALMARLYWKIP